MDGVKPAAHVLAQVCNTKRKASKVLKGGGKGAQAVKPVALAMIGHVQSTASANASAKKKVRKLKRQAKKTTAKAISKKAAEEKRLKEQIKSSTNMSNHYLKLAEESQNPANKKYYLNLRMQALKKASDLQHAPASLEIGHIYRSGQLVNVDIDLALHYYKISMDNGCPNAGLWWALTVIDISKITHDELTKLVEILENSKGTSKAARNKLAIFKYIGNAVVEQNIPEAFDLFKDLVSMGYLPSYTFLGRMYYLGEGVAMKKEAGVYYIAEAAFKGNSKAWKTLIQLADNMNDRTAQYCVGEYYNRRKFENINYFNTSQDYFNRALDQGLGAAFLRICDTDDQYLHNEIIQEVIKGDTRRKKIIEEEYVFHPIEYLNVDYNSVMTSLESIYPQR